MSRIVPIATFLSPVAVRHAVSTSPAKVFMSLTNSRTPMLWSSSCCSTGTVTPSATMRGSGLMTSGLVAVHAPLLMRTE